MAASASVSITGSVAGGPSGTKTLATIVTSNPTSTDAVSVTSFSTGFTSVTIPTNAIGVVIVPPAGNAQTLTLKGITGDTGITIHPVNPTLVNFATGTTTFGITVGGTVVLELWYY